MGVKLGRKAKKPAVVLLPPGTVLLDVTMPQRAVPWSASCVTRNGTYKSKRLVAWQDFINIKARIWKTQSTAYAGPVEISVVSRFSKGPLPDATNILKAVEDSLQGVVIVDDRQVVRNSCERTQAGYDEVIVVVKAI